MKIYFTIILMLIHSTYSYASTKSLEEIDLLFNNRTKEINTISAKIEMPGKSAVIKWDLNTQYINASNIIDVGKETPLTTNLVRNTNCLWRTLPILRIGVTGAVQVEIISPGKDSVPKHADEDDYCLRWVRAMITPYHNKFKTIPGNEQKMLLRENKVKNRETVVYQNYFDGVLESEIEYEVDLSDGLRIYSMSRNVFKENGKRTSKTQVFQDYYKSNGTWIPGKMTEKWFDIKGNEVQNFPIYFSDCIVNCEFDKDDFVYHIPYGSIVNDRLTGIDYEIVMPSLNDNSPLDSLQKNGNEIFTFIILAMLF